MELQRFSEVEEEEEQKVTTKLAELPSDAIYEILSRVPLNALQSPCRLVCKDWNNLSYEWGFRKLHSQRTQTISGYFIQTMKNNNTFFISMAADHHQLTLNFLPNKCEKIEACSSQGLLCCVATGKRRIPQYYICKPSTKEWKKIPNPRTRYWTEAIAMVVKKPDPLHYKLLRISQQNTITGCRCHCEIFDSNLTKWKYLKGMQLPGFMMGFGSVNGRSVSIDGTVHWLTLEEKFIVAFDVDGESCRTIELPSTMKRRYGAMQLVEYNGKLGMMYYGSADDDQLVEIWVMEEKKYWVKKDEISLQKLHQEVRHPIPFNLYSAGIVLLKGYGEVLWYDYRRETCVAVSEVRPFGSWLDRVFYFESDLVPCNL